MSTDLSILFERFFNKVISEPTSDHLLWVGAVDKDGYGRFKVDGKVWYAHRWIYSVSVSEIAPSMEVDHICQIRNCVNPQHLQQITHWENQWGRTGGWGQ